MKFEARLRWLARIGALGFTVLACGLIYLQVIRGPTYRAQASRNAYRLVPIPAPRGEIKDRHGHVLATNRLSFDVALVPQDAPSVEFVFQRLAELLQRPITQLRRDFTRNRSLPFVPAVLMADAPLSVVSVVEEHRHELPGVVVVARPRRAYPHGPLAAHVLGYVAPIDPQELARRRPFGYAPRALVGKSGIEAFYDAYLQGTDGGMVVETDHRGRQVRILKRREPTAGKPLTLTLDLALQQVVEGAYDGYAGACVVLDPVTGEVLAMNSAPSFDPETFSSAAVADAAALLRDPRGALVNRAIHGSYPPGSTFKIITALASLEERTMTPVTTVTCGGALRIGGRAFHCWNRDGHGVEFLRRAFTHSCNVYFMQIGVRLGVDALASWAKRCELGQPTGIDVAGEAKGFVPSREWKAQTQRAPWYDGDTANFAIGQGELLLTPLQAARVAALVANGGWLVKPRVVTQVGTVALPRATVHAIGLRPATRAAIAEGLIDVVAAPDGTGHRAWKPGVSLAGKTGTAQTARPGAPHGWMVGFTPVERPVAAFAILFEYGGSGGHLPALLAQRIAEALALQSASPLPTQPGDAS